MSGRRLPSAFACVALLCVATAARGELPPSGWEPVTAAELAQKAPRVEPDANAEVLSWRTWVNDAINVDEFQQLRRVVVRIKVFTEIGAQRYAKVDLDYPLHDVRVFEVRARCVRPDGSQTTLDPRAIVYDTRARGRQGGMARTSFAIPGVRPGCIVEYAYTVDLRGEHATVAVHPFQREIPVRSVVYYLSRAALPGWFLRTMTFHANFEESREPVDGYYRVSAKEQRAVPEEPDAPPPLQQTAWMLTYYTSDELVEPAVFWPRLGRRLSGPFDSQTKPDDEARALARGIVPLDAPDSVRAARLDAWVRREFRVLRDVSKDSLKAAGLHAVSDGRAALRQRGGGASDALRAFATLARAVDLPARLVRLLPSDRYLFDPGMMAEFMVPSAQVALRVNGEWTCFDPSAAYLPPGLGPANEEAIIGLFCDPDSAGFIGTNVSGPAASECARRGDLRLESDGTLAGDVTFRVSGHLNARWREALEGRVGADVDSTVHELVGWDEHGVRLEHVTVSPGADPRAPLEVHAHVTLPEFATVTDKRTLLEPSAWLAHLPPRYTAGTRTLPLFFTHAWTEADTVRIELPDGWRLPAGDDIKPLVAPRVASYAAELVPVADGRALEYRRRFEFGIDGTLLFHPSSYEALKTLFEQVRDRDRVTVSLKRAGAEP